MPSQNDIQYQQQLLQQHRVTLRHFLKQRGALGQNFEPPGVAAGIADARRGIAHCKAALRGWGIAAEDLPEDKDPQADQATDPPLRAQPLAQPSTVLPQPSAGGGTVGEPPPGPPTAWEKFRYSPMVFYPTMGFVILAAVFGCAAMAISAGADFGGFRQQLREWGFVASPTVLPEQPASAPIAQATQLPTAMLAPPSRMRVTVTITAITVKNIPTPEALDRLEPQGEGDIELNVQVGSQKLIWPAENQPRRMRAGESAEVGLAFSVESDGAAVRIPIAMLEKDPERGNENDLIMEGAITVDPASLPAGPQTLADQAGDDAVITYTVTTEPIP